MQEDEDKRGQSVCMREGVQRCVPGHQFAEEMERPGVGDEDPTVVCGDHWSDASGETNSQGVTGGVYRARVHIHRGMLIRDY
ncbi:hypothetical protein NL676_038202 [Syzygium grande]|nr:hypothetical protein NL676_038202 [Syzygium grande]